MYSSLAGREPWQQGDRTVWVACSAEVLCLKLACLKYIYGVVFSAVFGIPDQIWNIPVKYGSSSSSSIETSIVELKLINQP